MNIFRLLALARRSAWQLKAVAAVTMIVGAATQAVAAGHSPGGPHRKLDHELADRADHAPASNLTSVIVTLNAGAQLPNQFKRYAKADGALGLVNGHVLDLPNGALPGAVIPPN